jgi:REP element-mobilizing transposase RayT
MTEDEFANYEGKLRDIKHLKRIAKQILEERLELKRVNNFEINEMTINDDNIHFRNS